MSQYFVWDESLGDYRQVSPEEYDDTVEETPDAAYQRGLAEGRRAAADAILALTEPRKDTFRSKAVLTAYAVAAEVANGGPLSAEENALLDHRAEEAKSRD